MSAKAPLKAELMECQEAVRDLLERVIGEKETVTITDVPDGMPLAVLVPYDEFLDLTASHRLVVEHGKLGDR